MKDAKYNSKYPRILFYCDTDHNKSLFGKISEKLANTTLINQQNIENIKRTPCGCDKIIRNIENDYSKYLQYKYKTPQNSLRVLLKKWQRLGASEKSYQRRYRKYKIKKEFEKWVTFFHLSDCDIVAAWCPIKPKRRIVFEAALICNKSLLYFEDSPIPGYIICDHKGINGGLSLKKDIKFYEKFDYNDNINFDQIFNNIKQRKPSLKKPKYLQSKILKFKKNTIYCPLQVQDDTQIVQYGSWLKSIGQFIEIIYKASRKLPDDWQLVIREHPSSDISFTKNLASLSDDKFLVDNTSDSIEIIKHSKAIVTINSSVGFHALLKSMPVIVCGDAFWGFKPISYSVSNEDDLIKIFTNIDSLKINSSAIKKYLNYLFKQIFIPINFKNTGYTISDNDIKLIYSTSIKSLNFYN